jgi:hypothetical protein
MPLPVLEVPTYETIVPSTRKPVKYRPFLVKEHKVLLMLKDAESKDITRIVSEVVDNCTFNKLKIDQLAFFDLVHLFIELRKASIGEVLDLIVNCECGTKIETQTNLGSAKIINSEGHQNRIALSRSVAIDMRYPHLDEGLEAYLSTDADKVIDLLCDCIVGVHQDNEFYDARESTREEMVNFIEQLNTMQLEKLMSFFSTMPRVVLDVVTDCPSCKKHHELKLEGLDNFFV